MEIEPETLAEILLTDGYAVTPLSPKQRMMASMEIRAAGRRASNKDEGAIALGRRLASVATILNEETRERLKSLPLIWVESSLPHAAAIELKGQPAVVICRGLFDLVHYQTTLNSVCSQLVRLESERGYQAGPNELPPSELMHLAGNLVLADSYAALRPPATLADLLGPNSRKDMELGVSTSLTLLLLHELGHIDLGHTESTRVGQNVSVNSVPDPRSPEARAMLELAADTFSIQAIAEGWRGEMLASIISLHNVFQFFEVFGVRPSDQYPSVDRRLTTMIELLPLTESNRQFADLWLGDYRKRQSMMASIERTPEEMISHFNEVMDISTAYRAIARIRADLVSSHIVLETAG